MARTSSNSSGAPYHFGTANCLSGATSALWVFWMKISAWAGASQHIWSKDDFPTDAAGWAIERFASGNSLSMAFRGSGFDDRLAFSFTPDGIWHFFAFSYDPAASATLAGYLGNQQQNSTSPAGPGNPFGDNAINHVAHNDNNNVAVAELAIYKDVVRSKAINIIHALSQGLRPVFCFPQHLVFYNEARGRDAEEFDWTGFGASATLPGNTAYAPHPPVWNPKTCNIALLEPIPTLQTATPDVGNVQVSGHNATASAVGTATATPDAANVEVDGIDASALGQGTATATPNPAEIQVSAHAATATPAGETSRAPERAEVQVRGIALTASGAGTVSEIPEPAYVDVSAHSVTATAGAAVATPGVAEVQVSAHSLTVTVQGTATVTPEIAVVEVIAHELTTEGGEASKGKGGSSAGLVAGFVTTVVQQRCECVCPTPGEPCEECEEICELLVLLRLKKLADEQVKQMRREVGPFFVDRTFAPAGEWHEVLDHYAPKNGRNGSNGEKASPNRANPPLPERIEEAGWTLDFVPLAGHRESPMFNAHEEGWLPLPKETDDEDPQR